MKLTREKEGKRKIERGRARKICFPSNVVIKWQVKSAKRMCVEVREGKYFCNFCTDYFVLCALRRSSLVCSLSRTTFPPYYCNVVFFSESLFAFYLRCFRIYARTELKYYSFMCNVKAK